MILHAFSGFIYQVLTLFFSSPSTPPPPLQKKEKEKYSMSIISCGKYWYTRMHNLRKKRSLIYKTKTFSIYSWNTHPSALLSDPLGDLLGDDEAADEADDLVEEAPDAAL